MREQGHANASLVQENLHSMIQQCYANETNKLRPQSDTTITKKRAGKAKAQNLRSGAWPPLTSTAPAHGRGRALVHGRGAAGPWCHLGPHGAESALSSIRAGKRYGHDAALLLAQQALQRTLHVLGGFRRFVRILRAILRVKG